ncbi:serine hydrolase [Nocardia sp. IFM 10818]
MAALLAVSACGADRVTGNPVADPAAVALGAVGGPGMSMIGPTLPDLFGLPNVVSLAADFADLEAGLDGSIGLAIMPVGGGDMTVLGDWVVGDAWSTIKVPLALAALRNDPEGLRDTAEAAITYSDNGAAQALWDSLGTGNEAADAVEAVLHEAGDMNTDVGSRHSQLAALGGNQLYEFGATDWTLTDQVRFAAQLPCLPMANRVVSFMSEITPSQSWGLGRLIDAQFKGGWGPHDDTGKYLVRQFGLIPTLSGPIAVAMAAEPESGSFEDATDMMDKMAMLIGEHLPNLHGGLCSH